MERLISMIEIAQSGVWGFWHWCLIDNVIRLLMTFKFLHMFLPVLHCAAAAAALDRMESDKIYHKKLRCFWLLTLKPHYCQCAVSRVKRNLNISVCSTRQISEDIFLGVPQGWMENYRIFSLMCACAINKRP